MKLIDKGVLAAEIKRRRSRNSKNKLNLASAFEDNYLLSFIDSLEVKEVDLEKELDLMITSDLKFHKALPSLMDVAKHFFELGLKAQKGE